ncbi:MAG TPA: hypothetical protein VFX61_08480 [Micromonosporaceae bacterium]|nr:hypothetical protein [Micromonosporaceae bacterium]
MAELQRGGFIADCEAEIDGGGVYEIIGSRCRAKVIVDPSRWFGLEFVLLDAAGRLCLAYYIDTDLYDISKAQNQEFAADIEEEIAEFLEALAAERICIGKVRGKLAMIVPSGGEFLRVERGPVFSSVKHYSHLSAAQSGGKFEPLTNQRPE